MSGWAHYLKAALLKAALLKAALLKAALLRAALLKAALTGLRLGVNVLFSPCAIASNTFERGASLSAKGKGCPESPLAQILGSIGT